MAYATTLQWCSGVTTALSLVTTGIEVPTRQLESFSACATMCHHMCHYVSSHVSAFVTIKVVLSAL